ncbi:uncharacterized protein F13E9.13, mitochondrial isoform X3 [Camponotus floridanus]|uniref:uncharacterized protein F13E9.13, mitochondrial isoform X3 n=1 Tax=Camponotus floridanus TaxID=104421 RepID=UPI000971648E|nr:uncharacterized protein F13E9.13, mitochondrial isoform X3 [Camponotus floridanus]
MLRFRKLFPQPCSIIAMVHVGALPGTPRYKGCTEKVVENATKEALMYAKYNVDGILIENMHDIPYVRQRDLSPEITTMMTRICSEVRKVVPQNIACGVQILAGCNREAIAVAKATGLQFIRAEGFVFSHIADEGFIDANAGTLLRYRKQIDADNILIFADVKKKHRSAEACRGEAAVADRLGRDIGQRGQLRERGGRADCGIIPEDSRPMGERARSGESPGLCRTFKRPTAPMTTRNSVGSA